MFARTTRLALERLDDRNAPSSIPGNDVATPNWMPDLTPPPTWGIAADGDQGTQSEMPSNKRPVIVGFHVVIQDGQATFSGAVVDENPAGLSVVLTGTPGCLGSGKSVTTDANGNFTYTDAVQATVDTGWAYADTTDDLGQTADQKSYWVGA